MARKLTDYDINFFSDPRYGSSDVSSNMKDYYDGVKSMNREIKGFLRKKPLDVVRKYFRDNEEYYDLISDDTYFGVGYENAFYRFAQTGKLLKR